MRLGVEDPLVQRHDVVWGEQKVEVPVENEGAESVRSRRQSKRATQHSPACTSHSSLLSCTYLSVSAVKKDCIRSSFLGCPCVTSSNLSTSRGNVRKCQQKMEWNGMRNPSSVHNVRTQSTQSTQSNHSPAVAPPGHLGVLFKCLEYVPPPVPVLLIARHAPQYEN